LYHDSRQVAATQRRATVAGDADIDVDIQDFTLIKQPDSDTSDDEQPDKLSTRLHIKPTLRGMPLCPSCNTNPLQSTLFSSPPYCEYTGKYYCKSCHRGEDAPIPAHILANWDFNRYHLATQSHMHYRTTRFCASDDGCMIAGTRFAMQPTRS
jgi:hypothetical protein